MPEVTGIVLVICQLSLLTVPVLLRSGVSVPGIRMVDASEGVLGIEWIEGKSVRVLLGGGDEGDIVEESDEPEGPEDEGTEILESTSTDDQLKEFGVTQCI